MIGGFGTAGMPSELIDALIARGATVCAYDPVAIDEARRVLGDVPGVSFAANPLAACDGADALVVVTEWKEFRSPDFEALQRTLREPVVFDGRNLYETDVVEGAGLEHHSIGRRGGRARGDTAGDDAP